MSSLIGRTLSHYHIVDEISRGGMGVVYRAIDTRLNREVALKILPPDLIADAARRARFVQEARAASALEHPHIAVIHEIDEADGVSFIAMELIRGEKLSDVLARGPLAPARALELAVEIAEGLSRAHDKGIVHRDLKPANVMLTEDGHAKIIDFGLAKLVEPLETLSGDSGGETIVKAETDPGMVLGTVSYMSPEQARGGKVDHRSDVFSFGVLLHEMLTGRPPFTGNTGIDTMHAILHDPVPPLPSLGGSVPVEAIRDVQRILEKCLAKDPGERYQGMRDVAVDLRAARRRLESTATSPIHVPGRMTTRQGFMLAQQYVYYAMFAIALAVAAIGGLQGRWKKPASPAPAASDKPSVAVLYFENNTGNPQLDWLRTGLTDMMVTDLSQSPDLEVLGTDRLVQILTDMRRQDDRVMAFDTVQEIAKRAGVKSVILGSYVKAGETIRINLKLQEAATGRIVTAERVEAVGESNLFPTVDDLTRRIKARFAPAAGADPTRPLIARSAAAPGTSASVVDRDLKDVTTASIEAYRHYAEGINLHERGRDEESIPQLENAVAADPAFALAFTKLAVVHGNLGHSNLREQYAKRAVDNVDRLTTRERYYVEGYYYAGHEETIGNSIEAYKKAIDLYPDHASARHNLATQYNSLERYTDAVSQFEELRRRGMTFPATHTNLADAYVALDKFDKATEILQDYVRRSPDSFQAYWQLGFTFSSWTRFEDAMTAFAKGEALRPAGLVHDWGRWRLDVLRDRWNEAEAANRKITQSTDGFWRYIGNVGFAEDALYRGRTADARRFFERAATVDGPKGSNQTALARARAAALSLDVGQPGQAVVDAERALKDAAGRSGQWPAWYLLALAHARLGHESASEAARTELSRRADALPGDREKRRVHFLAGVMALDRRDWRAAIEALKKAEAMLPANIVDVPPASLHGRVPIGFALATAYMGTGDDGAASSQLQAIVAAGIPRVYHPLEFVRSLYLLGEINERKGDHAKAAEYYRRFLQYWGDGDIDRERVAEARKRIG